MYEIVTRLLWYIIVITSGAYFSYLGFGSIFAIHEKDPIPVRDEISRGQHIVSGIVTVESPCDELSSEIVQLSATIFAVNLHTWRDPSVDCPKKPTARAFSSVMFAPAFGIRFVVFLDGTVVPYDLTSVTARKQLSDNAI